jgi:hypothetical protein
MLEALSRWFLRAPARLVRAGLWMFFAGTAALGCAAAAQLFLAAPGGVLADRFPPWATWFVPESATGFTAACILVCWGVWAMGAGLRQARTSRRGR